jgi:hypothetical protein
MLGAWLMALGTKTRWDQPVLCRRHWRDYASARISGRQLPDSTREHS